MFHLGVIFTVYGLLFNQYCFANKKPLSTAIFNNGPRVSSKELKTSNALDLFYKGLKKSDRNQMSRSLKVMSRLKSKIFSDYLTYSKFLYKRYINYNSQKKCHINLPNDEIKKKFAKTFIKNCKKRRFKSFLNEKKLRKYSLNFLFENYDLLKKRGNLKLILKRIGIFNNNELNMFSNLLEKIIYNYKELPPTPLRSYLRPSKKLTRFIQEHELMNNHHFYYNKEIKRQSLSLQEEISLGNSNNVETKSKSLINFFKRNEKKISPYVSWKFFLTTGKKLSRHRYYDTALSFFDVCKRVGDSDQNSECLFRILFTLYKNYEINKSSDFIKENKITENFEKYSNKVLFWVSKVYIKQKDYDKAKVVLKYITKNNPLSFYAVLSIKELRKISKKYNPANLLSSEVISLKGLELSSKIKKTIKLFHIFSEDNKNVFKNLVIHQLRKSPAKNFFKGNLTENIHEKKSYFLVKLFSLNNDILSSFKVAYNNISNKNLKLNQQILELIFPRNFSSILEKHNENVSNSVVLSLIRQESAFNNKARSIVGARGLMQIMPKTAKQLNRKVKSHHLYNPELNIKLGTKYLEKLAQRYDGDLLLSLASYNAGEGNVKKWMNSIPFSDDFVSNVEMIPFKETRKYVKLIYRNIIYYELIEGNTDAIDIPVKNLLAYKI